MSKPKADWQKTQDHPLEYRAEIDGAVCIIRFVRGECTSSIHRDEQPVEVTKHDTYWHARDFCEANA